jgi:hypothetical protein
VHANGAGTPEKTCSPGKGWNQFGMPNIQGRMGAGGRVIGRGEKGRKHSPCDDIKRTV